MVFHVSEELEPELWEVEREVQSFLFISCVMGKFRTKPLKSISKRTWNTRIHPGLLKNKTKQTKAAACNPLHLSNFFPFWTRGKKNDQIRTWNKEEPKWGQDAASSGDSGTDWTVHSSTEFPPSAETSTHSWITSFPSQASLPSLLPSLPPVFKTLPPTSQHLKNS